MSQHHLQLNETNAQDLVFSARVSKQELNVEPSERRVRKRSESKTDDP